MEKNCMALRRICGKRKGEDLKGTSKVFNKFWKHLSNLTRKRKWNLFEDIFAQSPRDSVSDGGTGMSDMLKLGAPDMKGLLRWIGHRIGAYGSD